MGRFYSGDIEGKFWFAVQSSTDQEFFGMEEDRSYIDYYVDDDSMEQIEKGIKDCKKALHGYKEKMDTFFNKAKSYNNQELAEYLSTDEEKVSYLLEWYARLELGNKIYECVKEQGSCVLNAEM
tara:strand:- start:18517 stop:18888 length:372 start_codon:yes stop_codon:yes gene_type:complete